MKQSWKIRQSLLLCGEPIKIEKDLYVYQPTVRDEATLGDEEFGKITYVWNITRKDLIEEETDETWNLDDWEVYKKALIYNLDLQQVFKYSVLFFMHKKVEFLKMQNSIFIGELESGIELSEELFSKIQSVIKQITLQKEEDEHSQNAPRSRRAQEIHDKIVEGEKRLSNLKKEKGVDTLSSMIIGVVAHGHSYEEVLSMTLPQFWAIIEKIVQIENYEFNVLLSPYMDKKSARDSKHWTE